VSVIQISRVQIRRGQTAQTGFPQLASGEFGWSIDQQELYIGNGSVSEGAPAVGNTRLLTVNDTGLFTVTADYTYQSTNPAVITGPPSNPYIVRTLQSRLDDSLNVNSFGNDQDALRRAITFGATNTKVLTIPEGTYYVTATILVPPYAEIHGAGQNKTILVATTTASIFQTVGSNLSSVLTDVNSAAKTPKNIKIDGVTFVSSLTNAGSMVKLNCAVDSIITNCAFIGNTSIASTSTLAAGVEMIGLGALTCDNVGIRECVFSNLGTAIKSDYDIVNIDIHDNKFKSVDTGIAFSKNLTGGVGSLNGPQHVNIHDNSFYLVNNQGLYVGNNFSGVNYIKSFNNSYSKVGIGYGSTNGDFSPVTDVITFNSYQNSSSNDDFSRLLALNTGSVAQFTSIAPVVNGPCTYSSFTGTPLAIAIGTTTYPLFVWPTISSYGIHGISSVGQEIEIDYTLSIGTTIRRGLITVLVNNGTSTITDNFTFSGANDGGTTFSVNLSNPQAIEIMATTVSPSFAGSLNYSVYVRQ